MELFSSFKLVLYFVWLLQEMGFDYKKKAAEVLVLHRIKVFWWRIELKYTAYWTQPEMIWISWTFFLQTKINHQCPDRVILHSSELKLMIHFYVGASFSQATLIHWPVIKFCGNCPQEKVSPHFNCLGNVNDAGAAGAGQTYPRKPADLVQIWLSVSRGSFLCVRQAPEPKQATCIALGYVFGR